MPSPVLAVYSSLVVHQGSNLAFTNATEYEVYPNDADIGKMRTSCQGGGYIIRA